MGMGDLMPMRFTVPHNCPWMIQWVSTKKAESVEIAVTLAGRNVPEVVVTVYRPDGLIRAYGSKF